MKSILILLFSIALLIPFASHSQTGWKWGISSHQPDGAVYEMGAHGIDHSGNIIMASGFSNGDSMILCGTVIPFLYGTGINLIITKTDSAAQLIWSVTGNTWSGRIFNVVTDDSDNVYILGTYNAGTVTLGALSVTSSVSNSFMAKISASGTPVWMRNVGLFSQKLGIDRHGSLYLFCMEIGGYSFDGLTYTYPDSSVSIGIAKFNGAGVATSLNGVDGGFGNLNLRDATVSPDGTIYFAAEFSSILDTAHRKFYFGSSVLSLDTSIYTVEFVAKMKNNGTADWAKLIDTNAETWRIKSDWKNNFYLVGDFVHHATFGPNTLTSNGGQDMFICKYDSSGSVRWARSGGGEKDEIGFEMSFDSCETAWVGGTIGYVFWVYAADSSYKMYFGGSPLHPQPISSDPLFIARYDSSGNYLSSFSLPTGGDDAFLMQNDGFGNFYVGGDMYKAQTVIGTDTLPCPDSTVEYFFLGRYFYNLSPCHPPHPTEITEAQKTAGLSLYPNPALNTLIIESPKEIKTILITNLLGKTVYPVSNNTNKVEADISGLAPGLYFVRVNETFTGKFIKE